MGSVTEIVPPARLSSLQEREVVELPGVMTYGDSPEDAMIKVQALALRVVADRLEHGESGPPFLNIS